MPWTQRLGLTRTTITNMEAGRQRVSLHVFYDICEQLGAEPREVLPTLDDLAQSQTVEIEIDAVAIREVASRMPWTQRGVIKEVPIKAAEFVKKLSEDPEQAQYLKML